jgi:hypothetical protein
MSDSPTDIVTINNLYDYSRITFNSFTPNSDLTTPQVHYLASKKLISLKRKCDKDNCALDCRLYKSRKYATDKHELRCIKHKNNRYSIRKHSFFSNFKIPISTVIFIMNHLSLESKNTTIKRLIDLDKKINTDTITRILTRLQTLMSIHNHKNMPQFDVTDTIEIDEMYVDWEDPELRDGTGNENENKSPLKFEKGKWLIGLINRTRTKMWIAPLGNRKKITIQEILNKILPQNNATIMTDALASYMYLEDSHSHFVMNKKWGFARNSYRACAGKDPKDPNVIRVHVNTVENNWLLLRNLLRLRHAYCNPQMLMNHVHEYIYNFNRLDWFNLIKLE